MNIENADFFSIEKKRIDDNREGDYWVSLRTDGCGCCSDGEFNLKSKNETLRYLNDWIKKKEKELKDLKKLRIEIKKEKSQ